MKPKVDSYFNNGLYEVARIGKKVLLRNTMNPTQYKVYTENLKSEFPKIKKQINNLIKNIRTKVTKCDPIKLLSFASDKFFMSMMSIHSEIDIKADDFPSMRMTEYIQSILASSENLYLDNDSENNDPSKEFWGIEQDFKKMYDLINAFYKCLTVTLDELYPEYDKAIISQLLEAQTLFLVRGQRYQAFEKDYFENLLMVHDGIFRYLFDVGATDIVNGIAKLQYSLSQGKFDAFNELGKLYCNLQDNAVDLKLYSQEHRAEGEAFYEKVFGTKLRNVLEITGWSERLVGELSFKLGEDTTFFNNQEYPGWPIIDLPIQKRPFIKIQDTYYCFDYYSFVDNIYRSLQKAITRVDQGYKWADYQQCASEKMVETIFCKILPDCQTYIGNYYPVGNSTKQMAENDLLVIYSNTLLIVEVKAGAFVYTAPMTDFKAHISSYKSLIEKADWQCKRTFDYLTDNSTPYIYDKENNIKTRLNMDNIKSIYMISVTVDNINDFASKAEKLNFLNLHCNAISISVDDLMAYQKYFDSPLVFLHFLKHRQLATQEKKLALNDELDHLGMYIEHNYYTFQTSDTPENTTPVFYGYREKLDHYFGHLYHPQIKAEKPLPNIPYLFQRIIDYLETNKVINRETISNYLLDFSTEARDTLCEQVEYALKRQKETKNKIAIYAGGLAQSLRYTCFVNQPSISIFTKKEKEEYILASLVRNQEPNRMLIDLYFDENRKLYNIVFKVYTKENIPSERISELKEFGELIAQKRLNDYKTAHPGKAGKIGRNQLCPCGSGKKYKRCCGA